MEGSLPSCSGVPRGVRSLPRKRCGSLYQGRPSGLPVSSVQLTSVRCDPATTHGWYRRFQCLGTRKLRRRVRHRTLRPSSRTDTGNPSRRVVLPHRRWKSRTEPLSPRTPGPPSLRVVFPDRSGPPRDVRPKRGLEKCPRGGQIGLYLCQGR